MSDSSRSRISRALLNNADPAPLPAVGVVDPLIGPSEAPSTVRDIVARLSALLNRAQATMKGPEPAPQAQQLGIRG